MVFFEAVVGKKVIFSRHLFAVRSSQVCQGLPLTPPAQNLPSGSLSLKQIPNIDPNLSTRAANWKKLWCRYPVRPRKIYVFQNQETHRIQGKCIPVLSCIIRLCVWIFWTKNGTEAPVLARYKWSLSQCAWYLMQRLRVVLEDSS